MVSYESINVLNQLLSQELQGEFQVIITNFKIKVIGSTDPQPLLWLVKSGLIQERSVDQDHLTH